MCSPSRAIAPQVWKKAHTSRRNNIAKREEVRVANANELKAKLEANHDYASDPKAFARKCLMNIASAGMFSSDRTVREYAKDIWEI